MERFSDDVQLIQKKRFSDEVQVFKHALLKAWYFEADI